MNRTTKQTKKQLDPARTRSDILDAAIAMFAEKGYAGASIGDIAGAAGVPKSLVQYHFESKEQLFQKCVGKRVEIALATIGNALDRPPDFSRVIETRFDFLSAHPEMQRILSWASLESIPFPEVLERPKQSLQALIAARGSTEALMPVLLAISAMDGWMAHRRLYSHLFGGWIESDAVNDAMRSLVLELVRGDSRES